MKKTLSVFLAVLMLLYTVAFTAAAADIPQFSRNFVNGIMSIDSEVDLVGSVTIQQFETLYLEPGARLNIYGNLVINGRVVSRGGDMYVKYDPSGKGVGTVLHSENISTNAASTTDWTTTKPTAINNMHCFAEVYFPSRISSAYSGLVEDAHRFSPRYMWSTSGSSYEDVGKFTENGEFVEFVYNGSLSDSRIIAVPLNQYLFVQSYITDNTGKCAEAYDAAVITAYFNDVAMNHNGSMNSVRITTAGAVSYKTRSVDPLTGAVSIKTVKWENDDPFLKTLRIYIPSGTGYTVYGRITAEGGGEISGDGQTVRLKYGKPFDFKLKIDSKYSESDYKIFVIKGYEWNDDLYTESTFSEMAEAQKGLAPEERFIWNLNDLPEGEDQFCYDEYGYYHINSVKSEYSIFVYGVAENDTVHFAGGLVETLKNVFEALKRFFDILLNFFKFGK